jgi:hypothetical protein
MGNRRNMITAGKLKDSGLLQEDNGENLQSSAKSETYITKLILLNQTERSYPRYWERSDSAEC